MLLGNNAKKKCICINMDNGHAIVSGVHPSPLAASHGFFGSNIFKKVDAALVSLNKKPINWQN